MKGIILAGGSGTRLYPITKAISKQINPIYDKPMIYYPLSILMLAGINEILVISTPRDLPLFKELLGTGKDLGIRLEYSVQENPNGLAEAFIIGEEFIGNDSCALILGDNIFYGHGLTGILQEAQKKEKGATIFGYYVNNPKDFGVVEFDNNGRVISLEEKPQSPKSNYAVPGLYFGATIFGYYVNNPKDFGVVEFDNNGRVISLEEKPQSPKSNYAVPGLYFYDNTVIEKAKKVKPSKRGELEITSINDMYLKEGTLNVVSFGRGMAWLDTGTHDALLEAGNFVKTIQSRQGVMVACLEEIAYRNGWITKEQVLELAKPLMKSKYGKYLEQIVK